MTIDDGAFHEALDRLVPVRRDAAPDWTAVLRRALETPAAPAPTPRKRYRLALAIAAVVAALAAPVLAVGATHNWFEPRSGGTVPEPVFVPVRGRPAGWVRTGNSWFVVYVKGGGGRCGYDGATWRIALVETTKLPARVVDDRRISGAMCGNDLQWVKAGRFSDGRHHEVAFMLWTTPAIGATTYLYRTDRGKLSLLATFPGDRVTLKRGTVTVTYENRGRSPHGELEDVYRFRDGRYVKG